MKKYLSFLLLLLVFSGFAEIKLDRNFRIVFDQTSAIESEKTAAKELETYLSKIFGSKILVSKDASGRKIIVG